MHKDEKNNRNELRAPKIIELRLEQLSPVTGGLGDMIPGRCPPHPSAFDASQVKPGA